MIILNKEEKVRFIAKAFMEEQPEEYAGETLEEVMGQVRQTSDAFIEFTYDAYSRPVPDTSVPTEEVKK